MKNIKRRHRYLAVLTVLVVLMAGCSKSKPAENQVTGMDTDNKGSTVVSNNDVQQNRVDSGVLLGLSKDNETGTNLNPLKRQANDYRTLWIHQENGRIVYTEKKGEIITPYKDGFYKVGNSRFFQAEPNSGTDTKYEDIISNFSEYFSFTNIVSHSADKTMKSLFTSESFKEKYLSGQEGNMEGPYSAQTEWLWYVGNNYACVMNNSFYTGGGTFYSGRDYSNMYELSSLASLEGRKKNIGLADLLDKSEKAKLQEYPKNYDKDIDSENTLVKQKQSVDIENLLLTRKEGKWQVLVPLYNVYEHEGNGSSGRNIKEYITTDIKLPKAITSYDSLSIGWDMIKQKVPQARDAVSSPDGSMLAVLTSDKLLIYANPKDGIGKPSLSIDVDGSESIIMNQWATGQYVGTWNEKLNSY
ncbi:MAG: hypothetical protein Q8930_07605 [Bacillota bacterium]|nr:hypothetical protein [Bacillota bacterium]